MVLVNKLILTTYKYKYPMVLLFFQNFCSLLLLRLASALGFLPNFSPIMKKDKVMKWLPVSVLFVLMLLTGFYSLKYLAVPMVTIFKNTNNVLVTVGDWYFFGQHVSLGVVLTLGLMILAALLAGSNDLQFSLIGYIWTFFNCLSATGYVLYMRVAINGMDLDRFTMAYYNNILSLPLILLGDILVFGEFYQFLSSPSSDDQTIFSSSSSSSSFYLLFLFSGCIGFTLSNASFKCLQITSPTTYSMVGALNKIPLAIIGTWLFSTNISAKGGIYIFLSLLAGVCYAWTKAKYANSSNKTEENSPLLPEKSTLPTLDLKNIN